jgi:hypothetical protein
MIHLSLNNDVTFLLDRYFSDDVVLHDSHAHFASFAVGPRIEVRMYHDFPMYLALFYVDGSPVLQEILIDGPIAGYIERTQSQNFLQEFLLDYADAKSHEA